MADYLKELRDAIHEGIRRVGLAERLIVHGDLPSSGKVVGSNISYAGDTEATVDDRVTTGYDPMTGLTTVAFVLGVSLVGGTDVWSM